ncbi:hypothetical protein D3C84_551820 [compost metagenome]
MPLGQQAATGVHRYPPAEGGGAGLQQRHGFAMGRQAQGLVVEEFGDGEGVVQLDHADIARVHGGLFVGQARRTGGDLRIEDVVAGAFAQAGNDYGTEHAHILLVRAGPIAEHQGRRAIHLGRAALQQGQRVGDHPRAEHLFQGHLAALLGVLVERAVTAILHRHPGQVRRDGAALMQEAGGAHGIDRRQDHASLGEQVGLLVIALHRDGAAAELGQLLDAEHQHPLVLPGEQRMACQVHGGGAAGAGVLDVVDRDAGKAQVADYHLPEDHAAEDVGAVNRLDILQLQAGVGHGVDDRLLGQFRRHHTLVAAEAGHGPAHYMHLAHWRASRGANR